MDSKEAQIGSPAQIANKPMKLIEFIPLEDNTNPQELSYKTKLSSGIDLRAHFSRMSGKGSATIYPNQTLAIETGYKCKIHPGFEGQVRSRSGLALTSGIIVLNAPGTVDADYDGPLKVILHNVSPDPFIVRHGDRIAQMVMSPVAREATYMPTEPKERGEGGFGSTGMK